MEQNCVDILVTAYRSPQWKVNCIGFDSIWLNWRQCSVAAEIGNHKTKLCQVWGLTQCQSIVFALLGTLIVGKWLASFESEFCLHSSKMGMHLSILVRQYIFVYIDEKVAYCLKVKSSSNKNKMISHMNWNTSCLSEQNLGLKLVFWNQIPGTGDTRRW